MNVYYSYNASFDHLKLVENIYFDQSSQLNTYNININAAVYPQYSAKYKIHETAVYVHRVT